MEGGYKNLEIWQKGIELTLLCYKTTAVFTKSEIYGLTSQINRSASSIPANIAEGYGRHTNKEFIQFLYIALGSCNELETHLIIANKLGYIVEENFRSIEKLRDEVACKLSGFIRNRHNK